MLQLLLSAAADPNVPEQGGMMAMLSTFVPLILMFVIFYFLLIRPQRKREKEVQDMRSKIGVGDEVVTGGGIIGRVVKIAEDNVIIETGSDRTKIRVARWAIQANNTIHDGE